MLRFIESKLLLQWDIKRLFKKGYNSKYSMVLLQKCIKEENQKYNIHELNTDVGILGVNNQTGIFDAYKEHSSKIKQKYKKMQTGWIAYNPYRVNVGSIGIKKDYHLYDYISPAYVVFSCFDNILPEYLFLLMKTNIFNTIIRDNTTGTVRQNLSFETLINLQIPLPLIERQRELINNYNNLINKAEQNELLAKQTENEIQEYISNELGISTTKKEKKKGLQFVEFKDIERWGINKILSNVNYDKYNYSLSYIRNLCIMANRGKSPLYVENSTKIVLNQKCNRWNEIDLSNAKIVDSTWLSSINRELLTQERDIIINSTGEGTMGRCSVISKNYANLFYDSHILLIRLDNNVVDSTFFVELLNSNFGQGQIQEVKSAQATKQTELGLDNLFTIQIPLPPKEKQEEIVEHISKLREKIKGSKTEATRLRQQAINDFEQDIFA